MLAGHAVGGPGAVRGGGGPGGGGEGPGARGRGSSGRGEARGPRDKAVPSHPEICVRRCCLCGLCAAFFCLFCRFGILLESPSAAGGGCYRHWKAVLGHKAPLVKTSLHCQLRIPRLRNARRVRRDHGHRHGQVLRGELSCPKNLRFQA